MINENWRWQPWHRKMKELLDAGELGEPFVASVHRRSRVSLPGFHHPQGYMKDMPRWAVYELGVHYLDTFRFLFGEPGSIFARLHRVSPDVLGEDVEILVLGYPGLTCLVQQSFASVPVPGLDLPLAASDPQRMAHRFQVDGTRGTLVLSPDNSLRLFTDTQRQEWQFSPDGNAQSRTTAQQHFIDCLESGAEFETSGAETLKTMRLVYVAYRSAVEGSNIHLA
jgi:predicted dehydrogenase